MEDVNSLKLSEKVLKNTMDRTDNFFFRIETKTKEDNGKKLETLRRHYATLRNERRNKMADHVLSL